MTYLCLTIQLVTHSLHINDYIHDSLAVLSVSLAIYRGCFDAFKAVKQLTDDYVGCRNQTWNNRVRRWCLCDTDLCNRFPIGQAYHRLPSRPTHHHRPRTHHHPVPPPQPVSFSKNFFKNSGVETINLEGEEKTVQPALYRTVWTNWQAVPATDRHAQQPAERPEDSERKNEGGSRMTDRVGRVVSHSVYPDRWKANVAAVVDRRHAKSSEHVARGRAEPITFNDEGQLPRSNYSDPPRTVVQHRQPVPVESEVKRVPTADRQSPRGR